MNFQGSCILAKIHYSRITVPEESKGIKIGGSRDPFYFHIVHNVICFFHSYNFHVLIVSAK